jgi:hypothetical protein
MDDRQFVIAVAEKAMDNGFTVEQFRADFARPECWYGFDVAVRTLVLDPDFARSIWGTALVQNRVGGYRLVDPDGVVVRTPAYLFHMQQLVAASDKVAYLRKHVDLGS